MTDTPTSTKISSGTKVRRSYRGRENPNCRYPKVDDNFFSEINSELKAYLLGLIATDGSVSGRVTIALHRRDVEVLNQLRGALGWDLTTKDVRPNSTSPLVSISICSEQITTDLCRHLKLAGPGRKSGVVGFPDLPKALVRHFVRGVMDGDGTIRKVEGRKSTWPYPECAVSSTSSLMRHGLAAAYPTGHNDHVEKVVWHGAEAVDFLACLYEDANVYMSRKRDSYLDWLTWVPGLSGRGTAGSCGPARFVKSLKEAVTPFKAHVSDSGYDITLIKKTAVFDHGLEMFDSGIKVQPPFGWYFDLVPRSSLAKHGYALVNSVGIIDRTYTGSVSAMLIKLDPRVPDLPLPGRYLQLVPRPAVHFHFHEVDSLGTTARGQGGFGSTDAKALPLTAVIATTDGEIAKVQVGPSVQELMWAENQAKAIRDWQNAHDPFFGGVPGDLNNGTDS